MRARYSRGARPVNAASRVPPNPARNLEKIMKRRRDLSMLIGLAAVTAFAFAGATLAQPKLQVPRQQPRVTSKRPVTIKPQARGTGAYVASTEVVAVPSARQAQLVRLALPPGDYLLLLKAVIVNDAGSPAAVACGLHDGDYDPAGGRNGIDYASITVEGRSRTPITLTAAYTNSAPLSRTVRVDCQTSRGARLAARWVKLTAQAVDAVHSDEPAPVRTPRPTPRRRAR
jgi:hypothetical protein